MSDLIIRKNYHVGLSREQLFDAWISPETVIAPVDHIEADPKEGGSLKLIVETPQGDSIMHGKFLTLSYPDRLVYTWEWDQDGEMTQVAVDFNELTDGTEIAIVHSGFQNEESRARHDAGWDSYVSGVVQKLQDA